MLGFSDVGKVVQEIEKLHEFKDETAKLNANTVKLTHQIDRMCGLLERLIVALEDQPTTKNKKRP